MKLSMETYNLRRNFGEETAFKKMKKAGFDCVDFSLYWFTDEEKEYVFGDNYIENAKKTRKLLDDIGLECNQAHAPFDFRVETDVTELSNPHYNEIVKSMEIASILGAKNIVVHALTGNDDNDLLQNNLKYYKSYEKYCEKFNIHIAIENLMHAPYDNEKRRYLRSRFGTPKLMREVLGKLDSPWFVCCLDVGHATITNIEPDEFILGLDNKILKALHIQDTNYESDWHTLPYLGKIDWEKVAKSLKHIGYNGEFTFEIHKFIQNFDEKIVDEALQLAVSVGRKIISMIEN